MCIACESAGTWGYALAPMLGMGIALLIVKFEKRLENIKNKVLKRKQGCKTCGKPKNKLNKG